MNSGTCRWRAPRSTLLGEKRDLAQWGRASRGKGMTGPQAWHSGTPPMAQDASGRGLRRFGHTHPQAHPAGKAPVPSGPTCSTRSLGTGGWHRDLGRLPRQPPLSQRHDRVRRHGSHPSPEKRPTIEREPLWRVTRPCAPHDTMAGRSGGGELDTTPDVAPRQECRASSRAESV